MTTYLLENTEVYLTGRTAKKQIQQTTRRTANIHTTDNVHTFDIKVEVAPVGEYDYTWKKWVSMDDLYVIMDQSDETKESNLYAPKPPDEFKTYDNHIDAHRIPEDERIHEASIDNFLDQIKRRTKLERNTDDKYIP